MIKKIVLITVAVIVTFLIVMALIITNGLSEGAKTPITGVDMSVVSDGEYIGTYEFKRWTNTLVVHVENNGIVAIDALEDMFGSQQNNFSEEVFNSVIEHQNTTIDAISGATVTTKAYLKAIENALNK